jgi:hypothetical protein
MMIIIAVVGGGKGGGRELERVASPSSLSHEWITAGM